MKLKINYSGKMPIYLDEKKINAYHKLITFFFEFDFSHYFTTKENNICELLIIKFYPFRRSVSQY